MPAPLSPPPYPLDPASLEAHTTIEIYTGGGPGGQHRNKTQNAVRLHHAPSGLIVTATERRSLEANRETAFERLIERLRVLNRPKKPRRPTKPTRGSKERRLAGKAHNKQRKADRSRRDD
jgi:protein subunit release factor B